MIKTIFVPADGSEYAARAFPYAVTLAQLDGGSVLAAMAYWRQGGVSASVRVDVLPVNLGSWADVTADLNAIDAKFETEGPAVNEEISAYRTDAANALVEAARASQADLIVMSTHGRNGLGRWVYGSVAEEILARAHRPILLVPPHASFNRWLPRPGQPRRILVTLDGSRFAEEALEPAVDLARILHAEVSPLEVIEAADYGSLEDILRTPSALHDAYDEARTYVAAVAQRIARDDLKAAGMTVIGDGPPSALIAEEAANPNVVAVVAATHGRRGLAGTVMGSVATRVLGAVRVPVLLVRPVAIQEYQAGLRVAAPPKSG